jgi:hypothetical protein
MLLSSKGRENVGKENTGENTPWNSHFSEEWPFPNMGKI